MTVTQDDKPWKTDLARKASERREQVATVFQARFGTAPSLWCRAPGRVDLMGSHTDYNLGYVLTLPIDLDTWLAARPRDSHRFRFPLCPSL